MSVNIVHEIFSFTVTSVLDLREGEKSRRRSDDQFWNIRSRLAVRKRLHFTYRWRDARGISIICSFRVLNSAIHNHLLLTDWYLDILLSFI